MYNPPAFRDDDRESLHAAIRAARLANFVTATAEGPLASPLPLHLDASEGEHGVLYGHTSPRRIRSGGSRRSARRWRSSWDPTPT